jgi:ribosomal-protein-serine acetyltransferase
MHPSLFDTASDIAIVPASVEHAAMLAALVAGNREHLNAYLPMVATLASAEAARAHLERAAARAADGGAFEWHLFAGDTLCGAVRLKDIDRDDRKAKIGYFLGSGFAGKGIVSSALKAVLAWCFGPFGLNRIELHCASSNGRSMRVAERLGFVREGLLRQDEFLNGVFVDQYVYGLLAAEFTRAGPAPAPCAGTPSASTPSIS